MNDVDDKETCDNRDDDLQEDMENTMEETLEKFGSCNIDRNINLHLYFESDRSSRKMKHTAHTESNSGKGKQTITYVTSLCQWMTGGLLVSFVRGQVFLRAKRIGKMDRPIGKS